MLSYLQCCTNHVSDDMKEYILDSNVKCRREKLNSLFSYNHTDHQFEGCKCCDLCKKLCDCTNLHFDLFDFDIQKERVFNRYRTISESQKMQLKGYLQSLLIPENTSYVPMMFPNILFEFGDLQIQQIVESADVLFTDEDVLSKVEIWSYMVAHQYQ